MVDKFIPLYLGQYDQYIIVSLVNRLVFLNQFNKYLSLISFYQLDSGLVSRYCLQTKMTPTVDCESCPH